MTGRTKHKRGDVLGRWTLVEIFAGGGNGDVWRAESDDPRSGAVKILAPHINSRLRALPARGRDLRATGPGRSLDPASPGQPPSAEADGL
jgi:hypothetical protein